MKIKLNIPIYSEVEMEGEAQEISSLLQLLLPSAHEVLEEPKRIHQEIGGILLPILKQESTILDCDSAIRIHATDSRCKYDVNGNRLSLSQATRYFAGELLAKRNGEWVSSKELALYVMRYLPNVTREQRKSIDRYIAKFGMTEWRREKINGSYAYQLA